VKLQRGVGEAPTNLFLVHSVRSSDHFRNRSEVFLVPDRRRACSCRSSTVPASTLHLGPEDHRRRAVELLSTPGAAPALEALRQECGLQLYATFEQEFTYDGVPAHPWRPYELDGLSARACSARYCSARCARPASCRTRSWRVWTAAVRSDHRAGDRTAGAMRP